MWIISSRRRRMVSESLFVIILTLIYNIESERALRGLRKVNSLISSQSSILDLDKELLGDHFQGKHGEICPITQTEVPNKANMALRELEL